MRTGLSLVAPALPVSGPVSQSAKGLTDSSDAAVGVPLI
jgi:hypothetical protein